MSSQAANQANSQSNMDSKTNPSIFEVLAQQSLSTGLRRAANYLINILYTNNGQKYWFLYKNFDELYLLFDICVQLSHLWSFNASFSEHFYSLKRVSNDSKLCLNRRQFVSSLILLTAFPYIKSKFDSLYTNLNLRQLMANSSHSSLELRQLFVKTYPMIRTFCQLMSLYYQISYTVGQNRYHSPLLRLSNVLLINSEETDLRERYEKEQNIHWLTYLTKMSKYLANGFSVGLSVSAFFIQFLDFWYNSDTSASFAPLPIPPAPQKIPNDIPVDKCPICMKRRQNDTALITSGFVFCYSCIISHLNHSKRCPVTGYPSTPDHLIKIYLMADS